MFTTRPEIRGTFGAVAATHWIAAQVGMARLEAGGNAFDAAVAAGFALQVVEPHLNGPAGDMPAVVWSAREGRARVLCGQGVAPAAATPERFADLGLDLVPGTGLLAAVVPGAMDAWLTMLADYGTADIADVLAPAIGYARDGFPLLAGAAQAIEATAPLFRAAWPGSAALWLTAGGDVPAAGSLVRNPALATTWQRLLAAADAAGSDRLARIDAVRRAWYEGFVAEAVDRFCRETEVLDVSGRAHRGLLTGDDMAGWRASWETPVAGGFRGLTVLKTGPWGQGPALLQQLAMLETFDLEAMAPSGTDFVHLLAEVAKLALADRDAYYGDPDFVDVPLDRLLSATYAAERAATIGQRAALDLDPGRIPGYEAQVARALAVKDAAGQAAAGAGEPTMAHLGPRRGDTVHLDVVDRWGNMVSATPSGGWLQSSPTIPELGFALTTRAQMFRLEPGLPSTLAPGKRPRTTLTPTLVLRDGAPWLACGTPGGDQQDQWQTVFLLRHAVFGMDLQAAIDAPLFHTTHVPSSFWPRTREPGGLTVEGRFAPAVVDALEARGHAVTVAGDWTVGRLTAVAREDGLVKAAATPRLMQAYAVGR